MNHTTTSLRALGLLLLPLALVGCGQNPVRESAALADRTAAVACECWDPFGFDDYGECIEEIGANRTPTQQQCLADAYDANARLLAPSAECGLDVARTFHECVEAIVACNEAAWDNCVEEAGDSLERCPAASPDAVRALSACLDSDTDGDGIFDDADRCDTEREDFDGYEDTDGCPDPDAYDGCFDDGDCHPGRRCDLAGQRFCTSYCSRDEDCPSVGGLSGVCVSPAFERDFVCHQGCVTDDDCVDFGARCERVDGVGVCM